MSFPLRSNSSPEDRIYGHYAMATRFEVALPDLSPSAGRSVAEALFKEITRLELKCSFYRHNSELNRINQQALDNWVALDGEMLEMLCIAWRLWEGSGKAFDLTVGPLLKSLGLAQDGGVLDPFSNSVAWGMDHIEFDEQNRRIRFHSPGIQLDLGGIAKGYALDIAREILEEQEVENVIVHGGTSSALALGRSRDGAPWRIAIPDPKAQYCSRLQGIVHEPGPLAVFDLCNEALSVSSTLGKGYVASPSLVQEMENEDQHQHQHQHQPERESEQVLGSELKAQKKQGEAEESSAWIGHVLDPATGRSAQGTVSAFAIGQSAAWMDGLTTALIPWMSRYLNASSCLIESLNDAPEWRGAVTFYDGDPLQNSWTIRAFGMSESDFPVLQSGRSFNLQMP
jgi:thiamine biosynthesis lipoprotein ApbE